MIDNLEWYVGIFAEDYPDYLMMGELLTTMVAYDAFTQALTNPLLARNVFNEQTFSKAGMTIIKQTRSLQQIIARNCKSPAEVHASFIATEHNSCASHLVGDFRARLDVLTLGERKFQGSDRTILLSSVNARCGCTGRRIRSR